ncbi:cytochrome c oxidase subunit 3 [Sphingobacterium litopenaei]|uniref:Cytochrome c oxidase subunit 3 n=1 Tax=Sphingobacterium litopenaei TaxID=2763500 RepID=A0ABR7YBA5_9SPHI|nr:cytochrome c oxidase subunit 3 [Sphingobacterium litopenaei]MBD1428586.1 cytochrome c oxidase subunit 3 [Sphingobacterium litopenaei]
MGANEIKLEEQQKQFKAKKFNLWLGMIGMFMMFAALSSGFIVYTASGVDKGIKTILPQMFIYSTIVILVSSLTLHLAFKAAKAGELAKQKLLLVVTIVLGIVFFILQVQSWGVLTEQGVYFINNNASQSFIYIFTGLHLAHIIAGIIVLISAFFCAKPSIATEKNVFRMDLAAIFWHFLDLLWIYIYVFLLLNQ